MKRLVLLTVLLCLTSCTPSGSQSGAEHKVALEIFSSLYADFQLHLIDHKLIRSPKLKKITVDFYHFDEIDIREARLMIHRSARLLLDSFNALGFNRHTYHHYPLTEADLEISISFVDPTTHKMHAHGAISHVALMNGRIHYSKYVANEERHETVLQESFVTTHRY